MLQGFRKGGSCQVGWACAWNIVKEHKRAILDMLINSCFVFTFKLNSLRICVIAVLLRLFINPLEPISKGIKNTLYPLPSRSVFMSL